VARVAGGDPRAGAGDGLATVAGIATDALSTRLDRIASSRSQANHEFFETEAERLATCCHEMAERFARGGKLVAMGSSPAARSDARHVAVEFVHPVIVGKRALPAIALAGEGGALDRQLEAVAEPDDIAIAFGVADPQTADALRRARGLGCLTIAFEPGPAEWEFEPGSADTTIRQELVETLYHVLWELVHVFFDHRGLLAGREAGPVHDTGASSFLYPFLSESEHDLDAVVADVRKSILMKAEEVGALREQTLGENRGTLLAAAADLRRNRDVRAKVLALGNGGSATDAMDIVADLRAAGWRAIDLTEDASILTAIANDIGTEEIFQRQVIAYGRSGDIAVALSTSGNSANIIEAVGEARRRELKTVAFVGYDGGRVAGEGLADHVVITRSQHIPRIQEAQASAYHALVELAAEA
jgi:D-sedoheptulose 7-phosphate isomerase